jgi:serine/threonine protein kinase
MDSTRLEHGSAHELSIHLMANSRQVAIKQIKLNIGRSEENMKARLEEEWGREAKSLERINGLGHPHIVKCHAAIRRGEHRYFMFPWADGGSLREFWEATSEQKPTMSTIRQAVQQLRGIADALDSLHNLGSTELTESENHDASTPTAPVSVPELRLQGEKLEEPDNVESLHIRHGDIKPENILRFNIARNDLDNLGTLKLADMGLAKQHIMATVERKNITSTRYGTIRYEAPEARTTLVEARSRLYDIWSIGCVTLEYIIWILYGYGALRKFYRHFDFQPSPFFDTTQSQDLGGSLRQTYVVHPVVRRWIRHIETTDPECKDVEASAIKDLLALVKDRLLVVALNPRRGTTRSGLAGLSGGRGAFSQPLEEGQSRVFRANAEELRDALDFILAGFNDDSYVFTGKSRENVVLPSDRQDVVRPGSSVVLPGANQPQQDAASPPRPGRDLLGNTDRRMKDYDLPPLKDWEFPVDNGFADRVLGKLGAKNFQPGRVEPAKLCARCQNIDFWSGNFTLVECRSRLQESMANCHFCALLLEICLKFDTRDQVRFDRKDSTLRLSDIHTQPVLSIIRSPGE